MRKNCIKYKNNFTKILRKAKINFYKKKFNEISYSPKLTWKMMKEITISKKRSKQFYTHNNENISSSRDPTKVSKVFYKFFLILVVI